MSDRKSTDIYDNKKELSFNNFDKKYLIKINETVQNNNSQKQIRILDYISIVKIISAFSVVILHTNRKVVTFDPQKYSEYWISANAIECIFYFAVPMFVLCVGATLLDFNEKYGLKEYYY